METIIFSSIFIILVTGITILVFNHYNEYKRIERFFYNHNKYMYIVLEFTYYILFISMVFNIRFIAYEVIKHLSLKHLKIKLPI
jgi:hypothetical protein